MEAALYPRNQDSYTKLINVTDDFFFSCQASISMAPVNIFKHGADEEKAETARMVS